MEVYYHKTDGGAEYLSTKPEGPEFWMGCFARVDGGEVEIYEGSLKEQGITLIVR